MTAPAHPSTAPVLAQLVERLTGLALERGGVNVALDRFVTARLKTLRLSRIDDYVALAADPAGGEQRRLIDAITVPHTWFYRDPEQLAVIAKLLTAAPQGPLAVWIAGCATGEEAYTMAMLGKGVGRDLRVLATDINETALAAARRGVYSALAVRDVPEPEKRWIAQRDQHFIVDSELRSNVTFMRHNLVDPPPPGPRGGWDLVVCRNVLIYFAAAPALRVYERFARSVREGGSLVVGASEIVFQPPAGLELVSSDNRLVLRRPVRRPAAIEPMPISIAAQITTPLPAQSQGSISAPLNASSTAPYNAPGAMVRQPITPDPRRDPIRARERDGDLVGLLTRGHTLFESGEIGSAIAIYSDLADRYADVAEVWLFLGIARYAQGDVAASATALRASLCLDQALWPAGFYLARAYERLGREADAQQQYDLIAVDDLQPLALRSSSAVINELRAFQHDFRTAARRLASERPSLRRIDR